MWIGMRWGWQALRQGAVLNPLCSILVGQGEGSQPPCSPHRCTLQRPMKVHGVSEQDTMGSGAGWVCPLYDVRLAGNEAEQASDIAGYRVAHHNRRRVDRARAFRDSE